jgi:steroid delta-isomerase-like uncharacterized protein
LLESPGEKPISLDENKALVRELIDVMFNQGDVSRIDEFVAPDFIEHEELPPDVPGGPEAPKFMTAMMQAAFPDSKAIIKDLIAEDDRVAVRMTWTGTHEGEFMGIPPTGNRISINVFDILRIADGMVVEHWGLMDSMGLMQQLGVMSAPSEG